MRRDAARIPIAARPFLWLALVAAAWLVVDAVPSIGPLDRAKLGWAVAMPLTLLLPAVTGAVARSVDDRSTAAASSAGWGSSAASSRRCRSSAQFVPQCAAVGQAIPIVRHRRAGPRGGR